MAYVVSARKWRPQTFDELIGQDAIINALKSEIKSNKIAHAYLFSGPRGIGKTSAARIFAKAINCLESSSPTLTPCNKCENCIEITKTSSIDVIEIDGASNNGVQQVREVIDSIRYMPAKSRYKIYIIDEFHMLSTAAFNALLKTLEEPPPHAVFIAATTEAHKVIPTIRSRMKIFNFSPLSIGIIKSQLEHILKSSEIDFEDDALFYIAKSADGAMRDALSILDVVTGISEDKITSDVVLKTLGLPREDAYFKAIEYIKEKDTGNIVLLIDDLAKRGDNIADFCLGLLEYFRHMLVIKTISSAPFEIIPLSKENMQKLASLSASFTQKQLMELFNLLMEANASLRQSINAKLLCEQYLIKACSYESFIDLGHAIAKLDEIEKKYSKYASIQKSPVPLTDEKPDVKKPEYLEITDNFYSDFVDNMDKSHLRLKATLKACKNVVSDNILEGKLKLIFTNKVQADDITNNIDDAKLEFFRIFGKHIEIEAEVEKKDTDKIKKKRIENIKLVEQLFGGEATELQNKEENNNGL